MRFKYLIFLFVLLIPIEVTAKTAPLKPDDIHVKVNELLFNHVSDKSLNTKIMERALNNFVDYLDPLKMYFTQEEIQPYLEPSEKVLKNTLASFYKSDFSRFETIYQSMLQCIERRNAFEKELENAAFIDEVSLHDQDENTWCKNTEELKNKLLKVKSIQHKISQKFEDDFKDKFFALLHKRRMWREQEIKGEKLEDQPAIVYSFVLKSIASALDSQTDYFTPSEAKAMMSLVQQRLLGVGVKLMDDLTGFKILEIIDGGPAFKQGGIKINDKIIAVDEEPVMGMDIHQAVQLIQGAEGSVVKLTLLRPSEHADQEDQTLNVTITRGAVVIEDTRLQAFTEPFGDGSIAHLILHGFYQDPSSSSSQDLYQKIAELKKEHHLKGIILDLRNNGGGLLSQAISISSFFMDNGIVASTKQYDGSLVHYRSEVGQKLWDGPLVILMNRASASSAEIVAQCLQDYGRALIVGDEQSFGKGTYQITSIVPEKGEVNPLGEYKVTQGLYYTVSGKTPQLVGVSADIVVPGYLSQTEYGEQYSKYPLSNNSIEPNYNDQMFDIMPWRRERQKKNYLKNIQKKTDYFSKHIETLRENSKLRISANPDYQSFIRSLEKDSSHEANFHAQNDLQLHEGFNIIKDLIYLYEKESLAEKKA